jgi:nucleotide-binding universal stress UspA family protein
MYPFRTILVPIDFSEHASKALDLAIQLAETHSARIELLHSFPVVLPPLSPYDTIYPTDFTAKCREAAEAKLSEWREKVRAAGIDVHAKATPEPPSEAIPQHAKELGADLIVMGTRGLSGLKHVMLGSVAERTLRGAPCPVLTVRGEA